MAESLNGVSGLIGALERGEVVKCTSVYYLRKKKGYYSNPDIVEFYADKVGVWSTHGYTTFDSSADYELATDPLAPPTEPEPLAIGTAEEGAVK